MADEDRDDEASESDGEPEGSEQIEQEGSESGEREGTQPGDWERKPADEEDLRHDDSSEPLAEPLGDDADDNLAEQEAGDVTAREDEGFDRPETPDEKEVGDAGQRMEEHAVPLLGGSELKTPVGGVPTRSIAGIVAFIAIFLIAFFVFWALLGNIGILVGIVVGAVAGAFAVKFLADRAR